MAKCDLAAPAYDIHYALSEEQIDLCYPVMHILRPHLKDKKSFINQVQRQLLEGYHLVYIASEGEVQSLAGFRFLEFLAWGRVLYVDDLVTKEEARGQGYAGAMLNWLMAQAKKKSCDQLHLDSGPQRHDAHRLYLNHGLQIIGHHFAVKFTFTKN